MHAEHELGHDAEVAATTPEGPEEVIVLCPRGAPDGPIGGHDLDLLEIVDGPAEAPTQVPEPAPESEACHACRRHESEGDRQAVGLHRPVDLAEVAARTDVGSARRGIDHDGLHA